MPILDVWTWPRGDVPDLGTDEDVDLLRGWIVTSPGLIGLIAYYTTKLQLFFWKPICKEL
jgi:hypothetical protein